MDDNSIDPWLGDGVNHEPFAQHELPNDFTIEDCPAGMIGPFYNPARETMETDWIRKRIKNADYIQVAHGESHKGIRFWEYEFADLRAICNAIDSIRPIPVSERLPEVGQPALFYFPGMTRLWTDDGTDPMLASPENLKGDAGQWQLLTLESDGWLTCYGTHLKSSHATHWLPLPPKPVPPDDHNADKA